MLARLGVAAALLLFASGCTSGGSESSAFRPTATDVDCPRDVDILIIASHTCGYLTVLEDRTKLDGKTIRLFYLRVQPEGPEVQPEPIASVGYELAQVPEYGSIAGIVATSHRELILLDQRGTGHSEPSLACPTAHDNTRDPATIALRAEAQNRVFLQAVQSCKVQLQSAGIDRRAFTLTAAAEDLEDLRKALDVPRWNLISYGTASRILLEYMRRHSSHVRALVLDSPQMPRFDPVSEASANMTAAFDALAKTCRSSSACDQKYPDLASTLARARTELSRSPVTVSAGGTDITIDHTALVRVVRHVLSGSDERAAWIVPRLVHNAAARDVRAIAAALSAHPGMCLGYLPRCDQPVSLGAYLSFVCPLMPSAVASPVYGEAFGAADPYRAACRVWDLPSGASRAPIRTEVPALVLRGQYDPFSSATLIPQTTRTMPNAQQVTVPGTGHDVLEDECLRDARNDWLLHPGSAPNVEGCL